MANNILFLKNKFKPRFKITDQSLESLRTEGVPDIVVEKLEDLKNEKFSGEDTFIRTIEGIDEQTIKRYRKQILEYSSYRSRVEILVRSVLYILLWYIITILGITVVVIGVKGEIKGDFIKYILNYWWKGSFVLIGVLVTIYSGVTFFNKFSKLYQSKVKQFNANDLKIIAKDLTITDQIEQKANFLNSEINKRINTFENLRNQNRREVALLRIFSSTLGTIIAIILGLSDSPDKVAIAAKIALVLGSIITLVNAWEALWDPKQLWIRYTMTCNELRRLRSDLSYLLKTPVNETIEKKPANETIEKIDKLYEDYKTILIETNQTWETTRITASNRSQDQKANKESK